MKILVAEDNPANAELLVRIIEKGGYTVTLARDGAEALEIYKQEHFDALLTDWLMPKMDGMELIREIHKLPKPSPLTMVITVMDSPQAKNYALEVLQVDEYITKPINAQEVLTGLKNILSRRDQPLPTVEDLSSRRITPMAPVKLPDFAGVALAVSTGGPGTLRSMLTAAPPSLLENTAIFILQHGPGWMVKALQEKIAEESQFPTHLATNGMEIHKGNIYFIPGGGEHATLTPSMQFKFVDGPPENFVKPAADPLFKSVAETFGKHSLGVVLTGLGRDGAVGCSFIHAVEGRVVIQEPSSCVAPFMPKSVLDLSVPCDVAKIEEIPSWLKRHAERAVSGRLVHS